MSRLGLNREVLANITNGNQEAIKALEGIFNDVNVTMPEQIAAAINQAAQAVAAANQALGILLNAVDGLAHLANAPAAIPAPEYEDMRPAIQVGSISIQEADNVEITGGTIGLSAGTVALPSFYLVDRATGLYRIGANNWGLSIAGVNLANFAATLMTLTGALRVITVPRTLPSAGNTASFDTNGVNAVSVQFGGDEATGYTWQRNIQQNVGAVPHRFYLFNTLYMTLATTGLNVVGEVVASTKFGCNGKAGQAAAASGGAMATTAAVNVSPWGFATAAQADSIATKLNAIQAALIANGIMS